MLLMLLRKAIIKLVLLELKARHDARGSDGRSLGKTSALCCRGLDEAEALTSRFVRVAESEARRARERVRSNPIQVQYKRVIELSECQRARDGVCMCVYVCACTCACV